MPLIDETDPATDRQRTYVALQQTPTTRPCRICQRPFESAAPNARYCPEHRGGKGRAGA